MNLGGLSLLSSRLSNPQTLEAIFVRHSRKPKQTFGKMLLNLSETELGLKPGFSRSD